MRRVYAGEGALGKQKEPEEVRMRDNLDLRTGGRLED
jgi:hypothetical protein